MEDYWKSHDRNATVEKNAFKCVLVRSFFTSFHQSAGFKETACQVLMAFILIENLWTENIRNNIQLKYLELICVRTRWKQFDALSFN